MRSRSSWSARAETFGDLCSSSLCSVPCRHSPQFGEDGAGDLNYPVRGENVPPIPLAV